MRSEVANDNARFEHILKKDSDMITQDAFEGDLVH